jgi:hypothetical protein
MIDILSALRAGMAIYKIAEWFLEDVFNEIGRVYIDMAEAHMASAQQAFMAFRNSRDPESEIRSAMNHLRDSYNIYAKAVRRTVEERFMLFWTFESKPDCRHKSCLLVVNIATVLSLLYRELGEVENAREWRRAALGSFDYYAENYFSDPLIHYHLMSISKEYVDERQGGNVRNPRTELYISLKGHQYVENKLNEERERLGEILGVG